MRRKRVPSVIMEVGEELSDSVSQLKEYKLNLIKNVESIKEIYKGQDALIIISKFYNYINSMDIIIDNYDYWSKYFKMMSNYDSENINNTITHFQNVEDNSLIGNIYNTINYGDGNNG